MEKGTSEENSLAAGYREAFHVSSTLRSRQRCSWPRAKQQLARTCTAASMRCASASSSVGDSCSAACSNRMDADASLAGECGAAAEGLLARPDKQHSFRCNCLLAPQQAEKTVAGRRGAPAKPSDQLQRPGVWRLARAAPSRQSTEHGLLLVKHAWSAELQTRHATPALLRQLCCASSAAPTWCVVPGTYSSQGECAASAAVSS